MSALRKRGTVPSYWWDFDTNALEIIIETDDPRCTGGIVRRLTMLGHETITKAEELVADLKAGRAKP